MNRIIFLIIVIGLVNCKEHSKKEYIINNDTTFIFSHIIDTSLYGYLPDASALTQNSPFGDTILVNIESKIFKQDHNLLKYFPKTVSHFHFKFLSEKQICSFATSYNNDSTRFPNFLEFNSFERSETSYSMNIQNICVFPNYDKYGNHRFLKGKQEGMDTLRCVFGFICGGGMSMSFTKQGDSLKGKRNGQWSN